MFIVIKVEVNELNTHRHYTTGKIETEPANALDLNENETYDEKSKN